MVCVLLTTQNWLPWQRPLRNRKNWTRLEKNSRKYLPFGVMIVKIGPVDTEMVLLIVKKGEITEGKIHIPIGRFAERAKLHPLTVVVRHQWVRLAYMRASVNVL